MIIMAVIYICTLLVPPTGSLWRRYWYLKAMNIIWCTQAMNIISVVHNPIASELT